MDKLEGDCDAIVDRYADMVYRLALAKTHDRVEADDIFQEVFLRYVDKRPSFESEEHERAWFCRVTANCACSFWRKCFRRRTEPLDEGLAQEVEEPEEELTQYLEKLSPKLRLVIHLYYYEQYTTAQIAALLGNKESTVRMRLSRARRILRDEMEGERYHV